MGNPFLGPSSDFAIVSIDTLRSRNTFARLREAGLAGQGYDLVVFDEAHKLSADRDPMDMTVRKTARYRVAEALAGIVSDDSEFDLGWAPQSLMLLTATPHMGKPYPYFALWRLLEPDAISSHRARSGIGLSHVPHQHQDCGAHPEVELRMVEAIPARASATR